MMLDELFDADSKPVCCVWLVYLLELYLIYNQELKQSRPHTQWLNTFDKYCLIIIIIENEEQQKSAKLNIQALRVAQLPCVVKTLPIESTLPHPSQTTHICHSQHQFSKWVVFLNHYTTRINIIRHYFVW